MNTIFPFGFPSPTAFYLTMYLLTFVIHHIFMHYVLAGSLYVAWATIWPDRGSIPRTELPLAAILRDWMPFVLSAAITAGVAPLLFIQIVYQHQFYTANLLLWWRWMALVPVLIVAFYLLYLVKSRVLWTWPYGVRIVVVLATAASFVFTGFCWTVNHLLANSHGAWNDVYVTGRLPFSTVFVVTRMLIWIGGSFATMAVIASWQLRYHQSKTNEPDSTFDCRPLAGMSISGLGLALLAGVVYLFECDENSRTVVLSRMILPYLVIMIGSAIAQITCWAQIWRSQRLDSKLLIPATLSTLVTLLSASVIREGLRVNAIDLTSLLQKHSDAASIGGFGVFIAAAVLVSLSIGWCISLVRKGVVT